MKRCGVGVIIAENPRAVSEIVLEEIIKQLKKKKNSSFALPTGETPNLLYSMLALPSNKKKVDFSSATFFQLDEYVGMKKGDKNSFEYYLEKKLFSKQNFKKKNIHTFNTASKTPEKDCKDYEKIISKKGIDFCLLGLGENGHIAFNEPGSNIKSKTRIVSLAKSTLRVRSKTSYSNAPTKAFTIGLSTIMKSKKIIVIAMGNKKAKAVASAVKSKKLSDMEQVPVSALNYHKNALIIVDKKAAKLI